MYIIIFVDSAKLGGAVDSLKEREFLQRDCHRPESSATTNHMKFHKSNCQILHLGWSNPIPREKMENEKSGSFSPWQVEYELTVCPCSQKGQEYPEVHQVLYGQLVTGDCSLCSVLVRPHLECPEQFWVPK